MPDVMIAVPTPPPAGRRYPFPVVLAAAAATVAILAVSGLHRIDDTFTRRYLLCDLRRPETCIADLATVARSPIGMLQWNPGSTLQADVGTVAPGDVIKVKLASSGDRQRVQVLIDETPVATVTVDDRWRQHELIAPVAGSTVRLRRDSPAGGPLHLSRLSVANTLGHSSGLLEANVRHRLAGGRSRPIRGGAAMVVVAVPAGVFLVILMWDRRRGGSWSAATLQASRDLLPATAAVLTLEAIGILTTRQVFLTTHAFAVVIVLPVVVARLLRHRHAVATAGRRAAVWLRARRGWPLVVRGLQPEQWSARAFATTAVGAIAAFAAVAVVLMPRSPFEWDEVLFLKALDHFDVVAHSPHPPGYPVYVAAAWVTNALLRDPARSLQLVSIGGALLALVATGLVMRRLGAPRGPVLLAGALVAATPAFAFHANVGMADALATGVATAALWACAGLVGEGVRARRLVALAALTALAAGVRPQVLALLAGPGLWVLARAVLARRWLGLVAATATGAVVSVACWGPVIALTGWRPYFGAVRRLHQWMVQHEQIGHLPDAAFASLAEQWLVRPFGTSTLALATWSLVVAGAVLWWRKGERRLVLLAALAAGGYLLAAVWTLNMSTAVRYVLPVLPCLAILASGVARATSQPRRAALVGAVAILVVLQLVWAAPVYLLRARKAAPVWRALTWIRDHAEAGVTQVVYDAAIKPYARYLLGPTKLTVVEAGSRRAAAVSGPLVWRVGTRFADDGQLLFRAIWSSESLSRLSRNRYLECDVWRPGEGERDEPVGPPPPGR
ncbi:MAG: hypothetical protein ACC742_13140 [Thermoanaerobaculales bacterium]